jgi:chromosome segregation ATPase
MGLFLLLAGITTSSAILYFASLKERYDLSVAVNRLKLQLNNLEEEKQNLINELEAKRALEARLLKENVALTENIQSVQEQVAALSSAFKSARARVKSLTSKILILKEENQALSQEKEVLSGQLAEAAQERDALKSKFDSVIELKKAIRDLKRKIHLAKRAIRRKISSEQEPEQKQEPEPQEDQAPEGNRGFIIKDGKLTFPEYRVKIEVKPTFDADVQ